MLNRKAQSLIKIAIILAALTLFLRILIERLIKINIAQNESNAQSSLKLISTALENYAKDNQGVFPANLAILLKQKPPYLDKSYINLFSAVSVKGYNYSCLRLEASGYNCSAAPVKCNISGKKVYTISTGGSFISEECNKKD